MSAPAAGLRLSDQVAAALDARIRDGGLLPGDKLPTETQLAEQFSVSRTVIREAVSRLRSTGLLDARQGSGVYVRAVGIPALQFDANCARTRQTVVQLAEVRRALEAEVAVLAAQRRSASDMRRIVAAMRALDAAVAAGGDGVREDVAFHRSIAEAARNPFLLSTLEYLSRQLQGATRVTRANEARRRDFTLQVRAEHQRILDSVEARDPPQARLAASGHMDNAIRRIERAGAAFWRQQGAALATALVRTLPAEADARPASSAAMARRA